MAFMTLEVILFRKNSKVLLTFAPFFYFVYLLPSLINERPHTTLSMSGGGAIEQILSTNIWLYVFENVFGQVFFGIFVCGRFFCSI